MSITRGIVGCWSPSLGASGFLLRDVGRRNNHGTLQGMTSPEWQPRPFGLGVNFDGTDNNVRLPNVLENPEQTVIAWINPRSFPNAYNTVICKNEASNRYWTMLVKSNGKMAYYVYTISGVFVDGTGVFTLAANSSYCVALSYSASRGLTGYVNGQIDGTASGDFAPTTGSTFANIGSHSEALAGGGSGRFFDGIISEVGIWSRVLESAEIAELYRRGNGWLGRELTGMNQRRTLGRLQTVNRRRRLLCGGMT